jgi:hypothetical protein
MVVIKSIWTCSALVSSNINGFIDPLKAFLWRDVGLDAGFIKRCRQVICADEQMLVMFKQCKAKNTREWRIKNMGMDFNVQHGAFFTIVRWYHLPEYFMNSVKFMISVFTQQKCLWCYC